MSEELVRRPKCACLVKFSECDPFGHLYNVRYLDCMFDGREQHVLENYPLLRRELFSSERNWVISSTEIRYLHPACRGDTLAIESSIFQVSRFGVRLEITMSHEGQARLLAVLWSDLRYVDLQRGLVVKHTDLMQEFLEAVAIPMADETLDQRIRSLRQASEAKLTGIPSMCRTPAFSVQPQR